MIGASEGSLINAAQLLGCDKDELRKSLVCRTMQATKAGRAGTVIQYDAFTALSDSVLNATNIALKAALHERWKCQ